MLEDRLTPGTFTWLGTYGSAATNPLNWIRPAGVMTPPTSNDDVYFNGLAPNCDCVGLGGSVKSLHILNSYNGTVSLGGSLSVQTYEQTGANLSQPSSSTLTVTSAFNWTGGTLNSNSNLATVTISGSTATALIEPANGGTVNLGSNFNLSGGAVATLKEGIINVMNIGTVFEVNADCTLMADPGPAKTVYVNVDNEDKRPELKVKTGAWVKVLTGNYNENGGASIQGGSFVLEPGTSASFQGVTGKTYTNGELTGYSPWAYIQGSGATYIAADATINVGDHDDTEGGGMYVGGGLLSIKCGSKSADVYNVVGHLVISTLSGGGPTVAFDPGSGNRRDWGEFRVYGTVKWSAGSYVPYVDAGGTSGDLWFVSGTFEISGTAAVQPSALNAQGNVVTPESNMQWKLFDSDTSITAAANTPAVSSGWSFVKDTSNPALWWKLKKN